MRLASWNVNSLKVRLPHLLEWLEEAKPDLLGLQETKLVDEKFPREAIESAGYHVAFAGQPTYNGVAVLARADRFAPLDACVVNDPSLPDDQKRLLAVTATPLDGGPSLRFINAYMPNGSAVGSEKYTYKLAWLAALRDRLAAELEQHARLALVGDFNIAPADIDVHDPAAWQGQILCSEPERAAFQAFVALGLHDSLRLIHPSAEGAFSWWDYRQAGFRRNLGLRIDLVMISSALQSAVLDAGIDKGPRKREQPSDHAPVWADLRGA